jgi:hypothetical protein
MLLDGCNSRAPRHGLLACVLHVGLQYDMMELIKHLNAENKVSNEDKREKYLQSAARLGGTVTAQWSWSCAVSGSGL